MRTWILVMAALAAAPVAAAPAPKKDNAQTLARIKSAMNALGGRLRDLDTTAHLRIWPPPDSSDATHGRQVRMTARMFVKLPEKVRFQVMSSTVPLFNRWIFVQSGNGLAAYDPISDRRVMTDFKRLTGREPARLDDSLGMLGLLFNPNKYNYQLVGTAKRQGITVYKVRMKLPKPQQLNLYTMISHADLYVDASRMTPVYSESFTPQGTLATSVTFMDPVKTPVGWAPSRIVVADVRGEAIYRRVYEKQRKKREQMARRLNSATPKRKPAPVKFEKPRLELWVRYQDGVIFPWKIRGHGPDGGASEWTFSNTKLNTGLKDSLFRL